jgi:NAD(P)H-hydrate epimerase
VRELSGEQTSEALAGSAAVVDAIFGTGFSGAPRAPALAAIGAINHCDAPVVAADIASGVDASTGEVEGAAVEADVTVSFHAPKLGHRIAPGKWHTGELRVAPIGIPDGAPDEPAGGTISPGVLELAPRRGQHSTKFSSGQVLIAGGSRGLTGAVCLAAQAAIRAGAGYATVAVPDVLEPIFEQKLTEVMSLACPSAGGALSAAAGPQILVAAERARAVLAGPGLGRGDDAPRLIRELAGGVVAPLVIDADGLNALAGDLEALAARPGPTVLTPHAGELGRLLGIESEEVEAHRLESARAAADRSRAIVVLKGDDTLVVAPNRPPAVNRLASPALATAGTGDVLGGTIAALLARGVESHAAACAGVYAHARAGTIAARRLGAAESVIAGDVIAALAESLVPGEEA